MGAAGNGKAGGTESAGPLTRLARQSAVTLVGGIGARLLFLAAGILVMRRLDAVDNGEFQLALYLGSLAGLIPELGLRGMLLRRLADPGLGLSGARETMGAALHLRWMASLVALGLTWGVLTVGGYPAGTVHLALGFALFWMLDGLAVMLKFGFRGLGTVRPEVEGSLLGKSVIFAGVLVGVAVDPTPWGFVGAYLAGAVAECVMLLVLMGRRLGPGVFVLPDWGVLRATVLLALPFLGIMVAQTVNQRLGAVVLSGLPLLPGSGWAGSGRTGEWVLGEIGAFVAAYRIPEALMFLPVTVAGLLVPAIVRLGPGSEDRARRMAVVSLRFSALMGVGAGVLLTVLRGPIAQLTGAGKFAQQDLAFGLLGCWSLVMVVQTTTLNLLIAQGEQQRVLWRYGLGIVVNVAVTVALGTRLGAAAPALGLLVADLIGLIADVAVLAGRTVLLSGGILLELALGLVPAMVAVGWLAVMENPLGGMGLVVGGLAVVWVGVWLPGRELGAIFHRWEKIRRG